MISGALVLTLIAMGSVPVVADCPDDFSALAARLPVGHQETGTLSTLEFDFKLQLLKHSGLKIEGARDRSGRVYTPYSPHEHLEHSGAQSNRVLRAPAQAGEISGRLLRLELVDAADTKAARRALASRRAGYVAATRVGGPALYRLDATRITDGNYLMFADMEDLHPALGLGSYKGIRGEDDPDGRYLKLFVGPGELERPLVEQIADFFARCLRERVLPTEMDFLVDRNRIRPLDVEGYRELTPRMSGARCWRRFNGWNGATSVDLGYAYATVPM